MHHGAWVLHQRMQTQLKISHVISYPVLMQPKAVDSTINNRKMSPQRSSSDVTNRLTVIVEEGKEKDNLVSGVCEEIFGLVSNNITEMLSDQVWFIRGK